MKRPQTRRKLQNRLQRERGPDAASFTRSAGIGKTLSATRYARWDKAAQLLTSWGPREESDREVYAALAKSRTVLYTPQVAATLREFRSDLDHLRTRVRICIDEHIRAGSNPRRARPRRFQPARTGTRPSRADHHRRIRTALRQRDRAPALPIRPQRPRPAAHRHARHREDLLYSRVGFAHHYRPLTGEELTFVLARHWHKLGLGLDPGDFTDAQAVAAVARITGGNFRLLQRLFTQISRIMKINELTVITADVVETARSTLVIGATDLSPRPRRRRGMIRGANPVRETGDGSPPVSRPSRS